MDSNHQPGAASPAQKSPHDTVMPEEVRIPARDGYSLGAAVFAAAGREGTAERVVVVNSATAVPQRFYRHFAAGLAAAGFTVVTYDYRGIDRSRPPRLRGFSARARDWVLLDMAGVVDWVGEALRPKRLFFVGHSFGGQTAGLLDNGSAVNAMATMSAQSGHWRLQGGAQKLVVLIHTHLTLPLLSRVCGYMPMRAVGAGENLPKAAALEWARWCRHPDYLLGDSSLPLERFAGFTSPVLAYSFDDDDWGTARSVEAMMRAYPEVEHRHVAASDFGLASIGHLGYFRPASHALWRDTISWFDAH